MILFSFFHPFFLRYFLEAYQYFLFRTVFQESCFRFVFLPAIILVKLSGLIIEMGSFLQEGH
jgi:hypothetical protein